MKVCCNFVAADADERRGGAKERTAHSYIGHWPVSMQVEYGNPQAPGVAAKVEEAGQPNKALRTDRCRLFT